jgi:secondary thiamine-phosphate synthase enzyme
MHHSQIVVDTRGRGTYEISATVSAIVSEAGIQQGLCHLYIQHTSASLIICENADPDVRRDLETFMSGLVRDGDERFVHTMEGPDDMPAHVRSVLTQSSLTIPIRAGSLALGTWQGIYLWEHRHTAHRRAVLVTVQD